MEHETWKFDPDKLRQLRKRAGFSQHRLAERIGVDKGTVTVYEQGRCQPSHRVLGELTRHLECRIDELFTAHTENLTDVAA